jgi:hypothetical protein
MQTKSQSKQKVSDAISWLETEHPKGVELTYVDYRESFEDMKNLEDVLKGEDEYPIDMFDDQRYENADAIIEEYAEAHDTTANELDENIVDEMRAWLFDHDNSTPVEDLLKNTGEKLFYIETEDSTSERPDEKEIATLIKKYATTSEQKEEIAYVLNNQFYGAPVSFYFYAPVLDVYKAINNPIGSNIEVIGAYFSTIDRVQGSNWLGNEGVFTLSIPHADFAKHIHLDSAKGNGYGWGSIAGQSESSYEKAQVNTLDFVRKGSIVLKTETSKVQEREARLQAHWDKTKTCTFGDMNWTRHTGKKEYINNYPCGNKCEACGTFWID